MSWPVAELDPVRRLRVIAAATPGAVYEEDVIDAPVEEVWAAASNLELALVAMLSDVRAARVTRVDDEHLVALVRGRLGQRAQFDVVLRPGWCWMQSRFLLGGMAAVPEEDGTRFGFVGGLRTPGLRHLGPLLHRRGARVVGRLAACIGR